MVKLAIAVLLAIGVAGATTGTAAADPPKWYFLERDNTIYVSTSVPIFDKPSYDRIEDGLPMTVVIRLWVYPEGSKRPVAFQLLKREIVYDIWDEVYQVASSSYPAARRVSTVKFKTDALTLMTSLDQIPIANVGVLGYDTHYVVAVVAELNPVSDETLAEVRRWLSDGAGGGLDRGGSFFGSFVSVFVNLKIPNADRVLRLQSRAFFRPRPASPRPRP